MHACLHTCIHTCIHTFIHTHIIYIYIYIHIHIHIFMYIQCSIVTVTIVLIVHLWVNEYTPVTRYFWCFLLGVGFGIIRQVTFFSEPLPRSKSLNNHVSCSQTQKEWNETKCKPNTYAPHGLSRFTSGFHVWHVPSHMPAACVGIKSQVWRPKGKCTIFPTLFTNGIHMFTGKIWQNKLRVSWSNSICGGHFR